MAIVPYDRENHEAFVASALTAGAGRGRSVLRALVIAEVPIAVRVGNKNPNLCMGFAIVPGRQRVVWCYTKEKLRGKGIMTELLEHLGIDIHKPIIAQWRSPACDTLIKRGWPITYASDDDGRRKSA